MSVVFETLRLIARPWRVDDAPAAFVMYGDPEVVQHIPGALTKDVAEQENAIRGIQDRISKLAPGQGSWPLFERSTGELVGTALLKPTPASGTNRAPSPDIEIGWHLARGHWGRGFASEAGQALLRYGFEDLDLTLLHAVVAPTNHRSLAVARRIGLRHTGATDAYYDATLEHFELRRDEWRKRVETTL